MDENERLLEENIQKLINAGAGPQTRLDGGLRTRGLQQLITLQAGNQPADFPVAVLAGLAGVLGLIFLGLVALTGNSGDFLVGYYLGWLVIGINLAGIPLASLTIIIFRRNHAK